MKYKIIIPQGDVNFFQITVNAFEKSMNSNLEYIEEPKQNKWDKLNKELDDALDAEFGSEEPKQESVFENAKSTLRKHLFDNKAKVARDLEQMREWSNINKQETLEEAAENFVNSTRLRNYKVLFIEGAKWMQERSYSEEEVGELVYNIIGQYGKHYGIMINGAKLNELFEQFKKK